MENRNVINDTTPSTKEGSFYSEENNQISSIIDMNLVKCTEEVNKKYVVRSPIDYEKDRYPFCIVWTPLPLISWIIPCIGHTGICGSDGRIYDFAGSYFISEDNLAFGRPYKYVKLNPNANEQEQWDMAISKSNEKFMNEEHNICCNNCHSHVAYALNQLKYKNKCTYNMIHIWWMCIANSNYVSYPHIIKTYIGMIIMLTLLLLLQYI